MKLHQPSFPQGIRALLYLIRGEATVVGNGLDCDQAVAEQAANVKPRRLSEKLHQLSELKAVTRCPTAQPPSPSTPSVAH